MQLEYTLINDLKETIDKYDTVGLESRNFSYLANWIYYVSKELSYFPSVDEKYVDRLAIDKTKLTIFGVMIDDLADNYKIRNRELLENAVKIPWNGNKRYSNKYLEVIREIWLDIINSVERYPRYEDFQEIFFFDLDQFMDSTKYAFLINTVGLENTMELGIYGHHNMMSLLFFDMDFMCSPGFNKNDFGKLRPVFYLVQDINHVGNILSTFKREIDELDFSSPIISMGLIDGIITKEDVIKHPKTCVKNLEYLIPYFKERAEKNFEKIKDYVKELDFIELEDFYNRVRQTYDLFLSRTEYWKINGRSERNINNVSKMKLNNSLRWIRM